MMLTRSFLGSSALLGAGLLLVGGSATAAEVKPGGALDITIEGYVRFLAGVGDLKEKRDAQTGAYDFRNDTELHVLVKGEDEGTGIEYGATIELEADTSETDNAGATWIFLKGGFGELRFGDDDGLAKDFALGGFSVAVGTGGTDGEIIDTEAVNYLTASDSDATKVKYYSPTLAGFQLGVGYTPHVEGEGDAIDLTDDGGVDDYVEAGISYEAELGEIEVLAAIAGGLGHVNTGGDDEVRGLYGGVQIELFDVQLAGGWGTEEIGGDDRTWLNVGVAYELDDAISVSLTYGDCYDCDDGEPYNLVAGVEVGLLPGVALSGELSWFDEDRGGDDDDGVLGVVQLSVAF